LSRNVIVEELCQAPMDKQRTEIVERKGIGHPDSIADGLAESVSRSMCKMYLKHYDRILHHNTDETQIVGGQSAPKFGGGEVLEPVYILLVGRAVTEVDGERLPYRSTAVKAARDYLKANCQHLDIDMDTMIDCRIGKGSVDLRGVYETQKLLANDTSFGVGFGPFSETERLTLETERFITGELKHKMKAAGEDVKVMCCREGENIHMTVATAIVDRHVGDKDAYVSVINDLRQTLLDNAVKYTNREVTVDVNTADNYDEGIYYLTVTGLSMENGDDGSVGRGNRANGLITPYRPMSMEATAGKNPVTHVGKMYNVLANMIGNDVVEKLGGDALECHVRILSQIGKPIDEPKACNLQVVLADGVPMSKVQNEAFGVADGWLENISKITQMFVDGKVGTF